jgi:hypothetical protein
VQIAVEKFSEATIGYRKDKEVTSRWAKLFTTPYFLVSVVSSSTITSEINKLNRGEQLQILVLST